MSQGPPYGWRARQRALWGLVVQAMAVALPGLALATALPGGLERGWLLGTTLWSFPRVAGVVALWSTRQKRIRETWPTRLLFRVGIAACWAPAPTAVALLAGWALLALWGDGSALMAIAEVDSTLSALCLGIGVLAFGLGFRLGRPSN